MTSSSLAGKERIQEEFFHTFNALHEGHKQIVMTCDRPANEIKDLEKRLVSRFEWGLVTDMQPPNYETRLAILRKKAASIDVQVPEDVVALLAKRIRSNIRRLEGALIRVSSYQSLIGKPMSPSAVEGLLKDLFHEEGRTIISIDQIQKRVAEHYDIRLADMTSRRDRKTSPFPVRLRCIFHASSPANRSTPLARHSVGATMVPCCTPADWFATNGSRYRRPSGGSLSAGPDFPLIRRLSPTVGQVIPKNSAGLAKIAAGIPSASFNSTSRSQGFSIELIVCICSGQV